ncbi:MAG: hypothetical protein R2788_05940 [Saprospiraceae bacterium]
MESRFGYVKEKYLKERSKPHAPRKEKNVVAQAAEAEETTVVVEEAEITVAVDVAEGQPWWWKRQR